MSLDDEIINELKSYGADFVNFVNVSNLPVKQTKGYSNAILMGITLPPAYLQKVTETQDYVQNMILNNEVNEDEFHLKEIKADRIADSIANYITLKEYSAYSQSEDNLEATGFYDKQTVHRCRIKQLQD